MNIAKFTKPRVKRCRQWRRKPISRRVCVCFRGERRDAPFCAARMKIHGHGSFYGEICIVALFQRLHTHLQSLSCICITPLWQSDIVHTEEDRDRRKKRERERRPIIYFQMYTYIGKIIYIRAQQSERCEVGNGANDSGIVRRAALTKISVGVTILLFGFGSNARDPLQRPTASRFPPIFMTRRIA